MNRLMSFVMCALLCTLVVVPATADDPPKKLTPEERKELQVKVLSARIAVLVEYQQGKLSEATRASENAVELERRLYNKAEFPDGHVNLAVSLNTLGFLCHTQGRTAEAEPLLKDALDMSRRLFKNKDHQSVTMSLNNLGWLYHTQGRLIDAEPLLKDALEMSRRLSKEKDTPNVAASLNNLGMLYRDQGRLMDAESLLNDALEMRKRLSLDKDHADVATSMNNLAALYRTQDRLADAEPLLKDALRMRRGLFKDKDHPDVATSLNNLGTLYQDQGRLADVEPLLKDALRMRRRLFKDKDHPDVATSLNNLGTLYQDQGRLADVEPLLKDALRMRRRLFKDKDHPDVATSLNNLGTLYRAQGRLADAEPLLKDALRMRRELSKDKNYPDMVTSLSNLGMLYRDQGRLTDAESLLDNALETTRRLFKNKDHRSLATRLSNLGMLYRDQGRLADAEPLLKEALETTRRLFKNKDHPDMVRELNNLAALCQDQGRLADAEPLLKEAIDMSRRLFKDMDHQTVTTSLNNLGSLYYVQGRTVEAEPLLKDALEMTRRLFKNRDHTDMASSLNNLGMLYRDQGRLTDAEPLLKDALGMRRRLFKDKDHPDVARELNNLGLLYNAQGQLTDAEPLLKDALAMTRRLFKDKDHPSLVINLNNLAGLHQLQGRLADAEPLLKDALKLNRHLTRNFAKQKPEGDTLTMLASRQHTRDAFLSNEMAHEANPASVYDEEWFEKGAVSRIYELRQQQTRATTNPEAAKLLADLITARRRRAELLLAPFWTDPATREQREADIQKQEKLIEELTRDLRPLLPVIARADELAEALPTALQKVLSADAVVVDFIRFVHVEWDKDIRGPKGQKETPRYLAFIVTKDRVAWVKLGTAVDVKRTVDTWRKAIATGKDIPATLPAQLRELVWEKVRKELPTGTKTVYICPDADLCKIPFGALPGDKPGTILLEDFAVATIPHAPFLLDKLLPQDPVKNSSTEALVVGAVNYNADVTTPAPKAGANSTPLLKPGSKLGWSALTNTEGEMNGVVKGAVSKQLPVKRLDGDKATSAAVLSELPKAKVAHFATHGFFADTSFRSVFQLDEDDYKRSSRGERIGKAINSPLVMTGLVFAGANNPRTLGRGIVTGEALIDLDLSGLELAVLSACETGLGDLGDVAGGEGVFGLQRAFHYAGAQNVVVSLWPVPDESTAALMNLFYRNLWEKELSPLESLRQAQLEIYRNPGKIPELAKRFRGNFEEVPLKSGGLEIKPQKDGKAHPVLWAAFVLSGLGR
ncbi:CHAT domain-containing protein [Fimbriiglobus ruber]|nr:CHAT domain-containing protein [Fimbriiglobus ruber]